MKLDPCAIQRAAELIAQADGLLVTAGAGMGVDSGLQAAITERQAALVRINLDAPAVPRSMDVSIAGRPPQTLSAIDEVIRAQA